MSKPYHKYERRRLDVRTYRSQHRNRLRAEGKLSRQDPELAKNVYKDHPELKGWNEGIIDIDIADDYGIDLRYAAEVCNVG